MPAIYYTKMNYSEAIDFLFNKTLVFQHIGAQAYKPGLETTLELSNIFGNPHAGLKAIHIAGTNGKGSTAHLLAAILQQSGYKVGLYTSPHLVDFRERIRVNGKMINEENVVNFIERFLNSKYNDRHPSFFELTTIMAFDYFKSEGVDYAVIETGLGGRLDSTNILSPILSIITNISFDHTQFLGDTLAKIAGEKAGIIKSNTPVVIGESDVETTPVFTQKAEKVCAPIVFAESENEIISAVKVDDKWYLHTRSFGDIVDELSGDCQLKNANTVLSAVNILREKGVEISDDAVCSGFAHVCKLTGLMGRWMKISDSPATYCDTGHNTGGIQYIAKQLRSAECTALRIVIGFVSDKDVNHILEMMPKDATYYFTQASVKRAMCSVDLSQIANKYNLKGNVYPDVQTAYAQALTESTTSDMIYIGGSTFIVADLLTYLKNNSADK